MTQKAGNQIALGNYVYFFESPAPGMKDCVITAHGGHVPGRMFNLPSGLSVFYLVDFKDPKRHKYGPIAGALNSGTRPTIVKDTSKFKGPRHVTDQVLGKSLGSHWNNPTQVEWMGNHYYQLVERTMQQLHNPGSGANWVPHFISIRNRQYAGAHAYVWLSNVIELVQKHDPTVVNFYSATCRGLLDDEYADKAPAQSYP